MTTRTKKTGRRAKMRRGKRGLTAKAKKTGRAELADRAAYSTAEVARLTGLCRDSVYGAIRGGKLTARKLGKRTLITANDLRQFLEGLPTLPKQGEAA